MRIKVIKPDRQRCAWYANRVGEEFEVIGFRKGTPNVFDVDTSAVLHKGERWPRGVVDFADAFVTNGAKAGVCDCGSIVSAMPLKGHPFRSRAESMVTLWSCDNPECVHPGTWVTTIDKKPEWINTKSFAAQDRVRESGPLDPLIGDIPAVSVMEPIDETDKTQ
jgi:hypothetical protein